MLSPEEKKYFEFLWRLGKSYSTKYMTFEFDYDDIYSDGANVSEFLSDNSYPNPVVIPEKVAVFLTNYFNKNVYEGLEGVFDGMNVDDPSSQRVYFIIDLEKRQIRSWVETDYFGEGENQSALEDIPKSVFKSIESSLEDSEFQRYIQIPFVGGGDSGYIEDSVVLDDGTRFEIPGNLSDILYEILPGGWEINEGSQGRFTIDLEEKTIELEYTENIYETQSNTVMELDF
jgi:hypothetical protein